MIFQCICPLPENQKANLKGALASFQKSKGKDWKPSASEVLRAYPLVKLAVFDGRLETAERKLAGTSLFLLTRIFDLLSRISKDFHVDNDVLSEAMLGHLRAF